MVATVKVANLNRGMFAAEIDGQGEYVIFELLDSDVPEIGDIVRHSDFYNMGSETYYNVSKRSNISVYVQNVCGKSLVRQQCFL